MASRIIHTCDWCKTEVRSEHDFIKIDVPTLLLPKVVMRQRFAELRKAELCSYSCAIASLNRLRDNSDTRPF